MTTFNEHGIQKRDLIEGLIKGLEVMQAFSAFTPRLSISEVAERSSLSRAAARRYLLTLVHLGLAEQDGRNFRLTSKTTALGAHLNKTPARNNAHPLLARLAPHLANAGNLAVLVFDGADQQAPVHGCNSIPV